MKVGYKQTEIGLLPSDWKTATVKDILQLKRGRVISHRDILKNPGPYPVYSSQTTDNGVMGSTSSYDFEGEYVTWTTDGANAGTVFFRNGKFNCTNVCGTARPLSTSLASASFFAYYLDTIAWKHVSHVGNPKLMSGPFGDITVVVPPVPEQRAIAAALSDADALIAALDALIAKKRDLKQAAMQQLLTAKTRLPGFEGEWIEGSLGKFFDFLRSGSNSRDDLTDTGDVGYVHYGEIHASSTAFFNDTNLSVTKISAHKVGKLPRIQDGDLIMADVSEDYEGIGKSVEIRNKGRGEAVSGLHTFLMRGKAEFLANGFKGYLQFIPNIKRALIRIANGISVYGISKTNVKSIAVLLPPVEEQSAIAAILTDIDADIAALESCRDKTRAIKQGMMQELLTGRIRLL